MPNGLAPLDDRDKERGFRGPRARRVDPGAHGFVGCRPDTRHHGVGIVAALGAVGERPVAPYLREIAYPEVAQFGSTHSGLEGHGEQSAIPEGKQIIAVHRPKQVIDLRHAQVVAWLVLHSLRAQRGDRVPDHDTSGLGLDVDVLQNDQGEVAAAGLRPAGEECVDGRPGGGGEGQTLVREPRSELLGDAAVDGQGPPRRGARCLLPFLGEPDRGVC